MQKHNIRNKRYFIHEECNKDRRLYHFSRRLGIISIHPIPPPPFLFVFLILQVLGSCELVNLRQPTFFCKVQFWFSSDNIHLLRKIQGLFSIILSLCPSSLNICPTIGFLYSYLWRTFYFLVSSILGKLLKDYVVSKVFTCLCQIIVPKDHSFYNTRMSQPHP